jgi:KUP system potassium uptake protein
VSQAKRKQPARPAEEVPHSHGQAAGGEGIHPPHSDSGFNKYFYILALGALGVVYGDIGTSPLYAMKQSFYGPHGIGVSRENTLGVLSLIFWSLILVISIKYLVFVSRADNRGEGGILSLMSLLHTRERRGRSRGLLIGLGLFGAALLYGDGIITPAISVLSAVEGLEVAAPQVAHWVLPIAIAIIIVLFLFQRRGTGGVGAVFGPIMLVWFITIAILGIHQIIKAPAVLAAIIPTHAVSFFLRNGFTAFVALGTVFLVVTGGESLYIDMGHFGRRPIRFAWFTLVLPALLLNYFGQGALILTNPSAAQEHIFYKLAPEWFTIPLVILAMMAACIASQAVISGAFSITRQAIQLGYTPRLHIEHTSAREIGQIYIPAINWVLMIATLTLVLTFRSADDLGAAYGIAVTTTMGITTTLFFVVARERFKWPLGSALLFLMFFLAIDLSFFGANMLKLLDGGWVPLVLAATIFTLMATWKRGRSILSQRLRERSLPIDLFLADVARKTQLRVKGTAVFMTGSAEGIPPALLHNLKHNKIIHQQVILLTIETKEVPHISAEERMEVKHLGEGFYRAIAYYGFMEDPHVPDIMKRIAARGVSFRPLDTTYFLGRDTLVVTRTGEMARWRKKLFGLMSHNARSATSFFGIPFNQVVELGAQIEV